jgi:hypothetical protein
MEYWVLRVPFSSNTMVELLASPREEGGVIRSGRRWLAKYRASCIDRHLIADYQLQANQLNGMVGTQLPRFAPLGLSEIVTSKGQNEFPNKSSCSRTFCVRVIPRRTPLN